MKEEQNPWLEIPSSDYEKHMTKVGQAQALSKQVGKCMRKYTPKAFALLGCATGNGLEHVTQKVERVYAIDINADYLSATRANFETKITGLECLQVDVQREELTLHNVDLCFVGLLLEYVEPKVVLSKLINTLSTNGILAIVIQKSRETSFVSKTQYKSLEKLSAISNEVDENDMHNFMISHNMKLIERNEIVLTPEKAFISFEYKKEPNH